MEMRKLSSMDLFPLLNIMAKIGVKDLIQGIFKQRAEYAKKVKEKKAETDNAVVGAEVMAQITELVFLNIGRAQDEINTLLANICSVTKKDIEKLSMSEYMGLVMDFLSQPEFRASLNVIMSSLK